MPNNFSPNVADLGIRATSVLRSELNASLTALTAMPGATAASPQVGDFATRLKQEVNAGIEQMGLMLLSRVDSMVTQLLNLAPITGVVLASVPTGIKAGQSGTGAIVLSNLGANPIAGLELIASELKMLSGSPDGIDATHLSFSPNPITIPPRSSTTVTVRVTVPAGQAPGNYYGSIVDAANGQVRGLLSVEVDKAP